MTLPLFFKKALAGHTLQRSSLPAHLAARYRYLNIVLSEVLNQIFLRSHLPYAYRLTTVGIETNNTCNLKCLHCPTNREMKRKKGYMSLDTFKWIIDFNPAIKRVYLTNWGEPLLHPHIVDMIRYAHHKGKQTAITTNATTLDRALCRELLQSGLDIIKFSVDGGEETYQRLRGFSYQKVRDNILQFIRFRDRMNLLTWVEISMLAYEETAAEVESFIAFWRNRVDFVNFQPRFFSIPRKRYRPCLDLWRILVVLWDGKVVPCCADSEGETILGDATQDSLQKIFNGQNIKQLRKKHLRKTPSGLCRYCSNFYSNYHISRRHWSS